MVRAIAGVLLGTVWLVGGAAAQEGVGNPVTVTTLPHPSSPDNDPHPSLVPLSARTGDPLLDPPSALPGWVFVVETGIFKPHIKGDLSAAVNIGGVVNDPTVSLPNAPLDWTAGARIEAGYRFPEACGEFLVGYRSLVSEGDARVIGFDPSGPVPFHSRLNLNALDGDYAARQCSLGEQWDMKWKVGVRLASVYWDSRADGPLVERRVSNDFLGAGPHLGLELWRHLGCSRFSLYGRFEGAALWGQTGQNYEEVIRFTDGTLGGARKVSQTVGVPVVEFQGGVAWAPWAESRWRFALGYQIEAWYYLGQGDDARGDLWSQGVFLRG